MSRVQIAFQAFDAVVRIILYDTTLIAQDRT